MSGTLTHSPADVVRQLLVDLGHGTDPADNSDWGTYYSFMPEHRDRVLVVFDTAAVLEGRFQHDGETQEHHGVQIQARSDAYEAGYNKLRAIAVGLDRDVQLSGVTVASTLYTVYAVTRTSDVLSIGKEVEATKRSIFTLNALVALKQQ